MSDFFLLLEPEPVNSSTVECYIHNVSPVKKAGNNDKRYFNFTLQCSDKTRRGVCFSPERRSEMHTVAQTKSPVKIENIKAQNSRMNDEVTVKKFSKITPVDKVDFEFSNELSKSAADGVMPISSIPKLAREQLVSIKGQVVEISGIKRINTTFKGELRKQDVIVRDPTSSVKVTLWEDYVDCVELEKTYEFQNLRVKGNGIDRFLNTPQKEPFTAKPCSSFEQPLVLVDSYLLESAKSTTTRGEIIGFQRAMKNLTCVVCHKIVTVKPSGVLAVCQSCNVTQSKSSCQLQWRLRVVVQDRKQPTKPTYLDMPHSILKDLVSTLSTPVDLAAASEDDLVSAILTTGKAWKFTYDSRYEITDFEAV